MLWLTCFDFELLRLLVFGKNLFWFLLNFTLMCLRLLLNCGLRLQIVFHLIWDSKRQSFGAPSDSRSLRE